MTGRGGKGVELMSLAKGGEVVAAFPVLDTDQIMLVTDGGTLIRCPVDGIRIAGRATRGVRIVNVSEGERVVSAIRIGEDDASAERTATEQRQQPRRNKRWIRTCRAAKTLPPLGAHESGEGGQDMA